MQEDIKKNIIIIININYFLPLVRNGRYSKKSEIGRVTFR